MCANITGCCKGRNACRKVSRGWKLTVKAFGGTSLVLFPYLTVFTRPTYCDLGLKGSSVIHKWQFTGKLHCLLLAITIQYNNIMGSEICFFLSLPHIDRISSLLLNLNLLTLDHCSPDVHWGYTYITCMTPYALYSLFLIQVVRDRVLATFKNLGERILKTQKKELARRAQDLHPKIPLPSTPSRSSKGVRRLRKKKNIPKHPHNAFVFMSP